MPGYQVFDARLDEYFLTATAALCMSGGCWNLVGIPSVMVAPSSCEAEEARRLVPEILAELGYAYRLEERGFLTPQEVGRVRGQLREALGELLEEIDSLTLEILTSQDEDAGLPRFLK